MKTATLRCGLVVAWMLSASAGATSILYQQTFDGPGLPSDWVFDTDGDWSIASSRLDQSRTLTTPGHADAWGGDLAWEDYSVETDFMFVQFGTDSMEAGLGLRHDQLATIGNFFVTRVAWRGTSWNLEVVRTGASEIHIPLNQSLVENTWYTMRSEITGDYLRVWVNGVQYDVGSVNTDGFVAPTAGCIGVWSNNAHTQFDNVIVRGEATLPEAPITAIILGLALGGTVLRRLLKIGSPRINHPGI